MKVTKNQQIINGIIAGDTTVLKSFYKKNLPMARKLILEYRGTMEDVEDVFQEALVLLYCKLSTGNVELYESVHSYFMGICKNLWRNQLRKQQMLEYNELLINKVIDPSVSVVHRITQEYQQEMYHKHFTRLSDHNKNIMILFFEGKSMREIANIAGYTEKYTRRKKYMIKERLLMMVQSDPVYRELVVC